MIGKETALTVLPLYHIFSFTATLCFLKRAARQVLIADPRDINHVIDEFEKWKPSAFPAVNSLFNALTNSERFSKLDFSGLKMTGKDHRAHDSGSVWPYGSIPRHLRQSPGHPLGRVCRLPASVNRNLYPE